MSIFARSTQIALSLLPTGTTERVCLIQGTVEALNGVHNFIAEKVREMPQSAQKPEPVSILQPQTTVNPDRVKQVRHRQVTSRSSHFSLRFSGSRMMLG